jgi:hypothetical protein
MADLGAIGFGLSVSSDFFGVASLIATGSPVRVLAAPKSGFASVPAVVPVGGPRPTFDIITRSEGINTAHQVDIMVNNGVIRSLGTSEQPTRIRTARPLDGVSFIVHDIDDTLRTEVWGPYDIAAGPPLSITGTFPDGTVGVAYEESLTVAGVAGAATWWVTGSEPPGLTVDENTMSGTPTLAGTYRFTIGVSDSYDSAVRYRDCTVTILP